jgi:hypothetical protein
LVLVLVVLGVELRASCLLLHNFNISS